MTPLEHRSTELQRRPIREVHSEPGSCLADRSAYGTSPTSRARRSST
jgi:hypothetical protein